MTARRRFLQGIGATLLHSAAASILSVSDAHAGLPANAQVEYGQDTLLAGIRSRLIDNNNGARMHILEAGFEEPGRPCVILLHGFPELAYTWRKQLLPLARAGFHVIAPDLRGYGRSSGTDIKFDDDILSFSLLNHVSDTLGLVSALGIEKVQAIAGHDWGAPMAAWCALVRPDVFRSVVLMSTPFGGAPALPFDTANRAARSSGEGDIQKALTALSPPRKHYWWYCASREANGDMWHAPQGVHDLLRANFHVKSADWKGNKPVALKSWTASELAKMPRYYVMDLGKGMAETVAAEMPTKAQIAECKWLTEAELRVYSAEYQRTGFQGGLQSYRVLIDPRYEGELNAFAGRRIDVPALFIAGASEWGPYQTPGALQAMRGGACTKLKGVHFVEGAGHWPGEEQPVKVNDLLIEFLRSARSA
ncbi:MAG: alpha/beta hydrolase [Gammaproteobacteria bacterium]